MPATLERPVRIAAADLVGFTDTAGIRRASLVTCPGGRPQPLEGLGVAFSPRRPVGQKAPEAESADVSVFGV